jgi:hypothetical protein
MEDTLLRITKLKNKNNNIFISRKGLPYQHPLPLALQQPQPFWLQLFWLEH